MPCEYEVLTDDSDTLWITYSLVCNKFCLLNFMNYADVVTSTILGSLNDPASERDGKMREEQHHIARAVSNPTFHDNNAEQLKNAPYSDPSKSGISSRPAFGSKNTEDVIPTLPEYPWYVLRPMSCLGLILT